MPEPAPAKQLFTRPRVIVAAMVLVTALAVAGFVFGLFDPEPEELVKITFTGFTNSLDRTPHRALLELKKTSDRVAYSSAVDPSGQPYVVTDPSGEAFADLWLKARFRSHSPTGDVLWESALCKTNVLWSTLVAPTELCTCFALPEDGRTGRVEVFYWYVKPGLFDSRSGASWWSSLNGEYFERWAVYEQEIQCARVRPDGTVEPPRLVPKGEKKQP